MILLSMYSCDSSRTETPITKVPESKIDTTLDICVYDSTLLQENFQRANPPADFSKGKPVRPPKPTTSGYSCIYLDFDGEVGKWTNWNGGQTLTCAPATLTADQKLQTVNEVAALYAAYKVVITDDLSVYNGANSSRRIRIIVTPTSAWYGGVSGIAFNGSFSWGTGVPAFVFSDRLYNGPHYIAEIAAHEAGHTLGLRHQSEYNTDCTLKYTYRMGVVMGNSMYVPQGAWVLGTTYSCNVFQDDKQMLTSVLGLAL